MLKKTQFTNVNKNGKQTHTLQLLNIKVKTPQFTKVKKKVLKK